MKVVALPIRNRDELRVTELSKACDAFDGIHEIRRTLRPGCEQHNLLTTAIESLAELLGEPWDEIA